MKIKNLKKPKKFTIIITIIIVIVFVLGIVIGRKMESNQMSNRKMSSSSDNSSNTVEKEVGTQTIENTLTSAGEIVASSTEKLSLSTSKYFSTMCAEEGDIVLAGGNILQYSNGTYLTADYNCVIVEYSVPDSGSICTSSNYVEVQNIETMAMNLTISESEINSVAVGQEVEIEISALDDKTYTGSITSVSGVGTYSTSGTTFSAVVQFENDGDVKVGMSASCTIVLEKAEDCIAVPIEAVQTSGNQKYVVVVKEDGITENVNVETGISNDSYVQVTSGLSGGEMIQMIETSSNIKGGNGGIPDFSDGGMPGGDFSGERPTMPGQN